MGKRKPPSRETAERDEIVGALLYAEHCSTIEDLVVRLHRQLDRTTAALEATSEALLSLRDTVAQVQRDRDDLRERATQIEAQREVEAQRLAAEVATARAAAAASDHQSRAAQTAADRACRVATDARTTANETRAILGARQIPTGKKLKITPTDAWAWLRLERSVRAELGPLTRDQLADPRAADLLAVVYRAQTAALGLERADAIRDLRVALQITRARMEST